MPCTTAVPRMPNTVPRIGQSGDVDQPIRLRAGDAADDRGQRMRDRIAIDIEEEGDEQREHEAQDAVGHPQQYPQSGFRQACRTTAGRNATITDRSAAQPFQRLAQASRPSTRQPARASHGAEGRPVAADCSSTSAHQMRVASLAPRPAPPAPAATRPATAASSTMVTVDAPTRRNPSARRPREHRPAGEHQDRCPQDRREERVQDHHAPDGYAAQQQAHQHAFGGHGSSGEKNQAPDDAAARNPPHPYRRSAGHSTAWPKRGRSRA